MAILIRHEIKERAAGSDVVEVMLSVDGSTVGTIEKTPGGVFIAKTKGLIPALDRITGASADRVWAKITEMVATQEIYLAKRITGVQKS